MDYDFETAFAAYGTFDGETAFPVSVYVYVKIHEDYIGHISMGRNTLRRTFELEPVEIRAYLFSGEEYKVTDEDKKDWVYDIEESMSRAFQKRRSA